MPRCSVIVPAYNVEAYVAQALASALGQTQRDIEIIVVNDGSTDRTVDAISPFSSRIIYVEQPNGGPAVARNRALERATGEYVALLDADDFWLSHRLERVVRFLDDREDVGLATSDSFLVVGEQPTRRTYYRHGPGRRGFRRDHQAYWILQYNFVHGMVVFRRELIDRHGGFDQEIPWGVEDWDLWVRFITGGEHAGLVDEPLGYYRVRATSLSHDLSRTYANEVAVLRRALARPESRDTRGLGGRIAFAEGARSLASRDRGTAARHFRQAARDRELPLRTRTIAGVAAWQPGFAWALQMRRLRRRTFSSASGASPGAPLPRKRAGPP